MQARLIFWGIIILGIAGVGGWFTYRWVEAELVRLKTEAKDADRRATNAAQRAKNVLEALSQSEEISRKRARALAQSQKDEALFRNAFEALYAQSQIAKDWGDSPIPNAVRCLRRKLDPRLPSDNLQCSDESIGGNFRAAPNGPNEQRPSIRDKLTTERLTKLQP